MIVLDTHVWIWWVSEPDRLSSGAHATITNARQVGICPISIWEISTKEAKGRLSLDRDLDVWVHQAVARPGAVLLELSPEIAILAGQLGERGFHGDPADRMIAASAMCHGVELVTKDQAIRDFDGVRTVW
ncbi:MAG: type II toxin-antitoxin system VapC family toxin [Thermoanaerobaculia bacterium]